MKQVANMPLTLQDLESFVGNAEETFERSQDLFQKMLKHTGIRSNSRAQWSGLPHQTLSDEASLHERRTEFSRKIWKSLWSNQGIYSARILRTMLHAMDTDNNGILSSHCVEGALTQNGLRIKTSEVEVLRELFQAPSVRDTEFPIDYVLFLAYGYRNWSKRREEATEEAFEFLSSKCPAGILQMRALFKELKAKELTPELYPALQGAEHDAGSAFLRQWGECMAGTDGTITWEEFCFHYLDLSTCFDRDAEYVSFVLRSFGLDPDDWLAKRVFRTFAPPGYDADVLPPQEFTRMLKVFYSDISEEEAYAWYECMDEDRTGQVSLEEFIECKVLKAKRLFDDYVADPERNASKEEMVVILRSLCPTLSVEEAVVLYQYADLDGNGSIDFIEFLENQLLKMLQVYDQSNKGKSTRKNFSEEEMAAIMKKLDPGLDAPEIQAIYKAVDTDGSGSISFVEFCQSQVLRAKSLFDRYDLDRSRTLTQIKFLEMLRFFDSGFTEDEEKAICDLVMNHQTGKVSLSSFLNHNIIKLKLLFDKYDRDRGRSLDRGEFKVMLQELFTSDERDVETLINQVCPADETGGISFLQYVSSFKELSKRHDALVLARKRKEREKAKAKGLSYT